MGEIRTNDLQEVKTPAAGGFSEIKPQEGMTPDEARESLHNNFESIGKKQAEFENNPGKEYYDDNGKVYRRGNDLAPNSEFSINSYNYETDKLGRTISAEGTLKIRDPEYVRKMDTDAAVYKGEKTEGYEKGHLIGYQFGGSGGMENLSIMSGEVNHGDFFKLETKLASAVKDGADVKMKVEPVYEGSSNKPSEYKVTYTINGEKEVVVFNNGSEAKNDK